MAGTPGLTASALSRRAISSARSPLWATAGATWIDNFGASTALIGVYFIAKRAYGFSDGALLMLGLVQGVTYVIAALAAGPLTRRLAGPDRPISTRAMLAWLHVLLSVVCLAPVVLRSPISMWIVVGVYAPLTGILWPTIESFLSAGRTGADLRRSSGIFNLSWASCQVVTFWLIAPFMREPESALWAIPVMGFSHLLAVPLIFRFQREPAAHGEGGHAHSPEEAARYRLLLHCHRLLLTLSYVVFSALNPLLPSIIGDRLRLDATLATPLTSVWMISRLGAFFVMGWWEGWHGRFLTLLWPLILLIGGMGMALLAPSVWVLAIGLAFFGIGMGSIYSAGFYYAMEVGSAGVDAGGKHEALIGVGYSVGPLLGTAAGGAIRAGVAPEGAKPVMILGLIALATALCGGQILRWTRKGRYRTESE